MIVTAEWIFLFEGLVRQTRASNLEYWQDSQELFIWRIGKMGDFYLVVWHGRPELACQTGISLLEDWHARQECFILRIGRADRNFSLGWLARETGVSYLENWHGRRSFLFGGLVRLRGVSFLGNWHGSQELFWGLARQTELLIWRNGMAENSFLFGGLSWTGALIWRFSSPDRIIFGELAWQTGVSYFEDCHSRQHFLILSFAKVDRSFLFGGLARLTGASFLEDWQNLIQPYILPLCFVLYKSQGE